MSKHLKPVRTTLDDSPAMQQMILDLARRNDEAAIVEYDETRLYALTAKGREVIESHKVIGTGVDHRSSR